MATQKTNPAIAAARRAKGTTAPPILDKIKTKRCVEALKEKFGIEKGVVLTAEMLERNKELFQYYITLFTVYPDLLLDILTPTESNFTLFFYQRIFLRGCMRYRYNFVIAPRAFSKSFLAILALYLKCMFQPGGKYFICAPAISQSVKIAREKLTEIWQLFPLLQKEIFSKNFSIDEIRLTFTNGSIFDVVSTRNTQRGGRRSGGICL